MDGSAPLYDQYFNNPSSPLNNSVRLPGLNFEQQYDIQNSYFDHSGVISTTNFKGGDRSNVAFFSNSGTSGSIDPATLGTFTLARTTQVLFFYSSFFDNNAAGRTASMTLSIDGTTLGFPAEVRNDLGATAFTLSNFTLQTLGVGTHVVGLSFSNLGGGTALAFGSGLTWLLLGS